jgi:hypothetical protein
MEFPKTLSEAIAQIDEHVAENLMPPPHYKYRLTALIVDKLKSWDVTNTGKFPIITVYYPNQHVPSTLNAVHTLPTTKLQIEFDANEMKKFLHV